MGRSIQWSQNACTEQLFHYQSGPGAPLSDFNPPPSNRDWNSNVRCLLHRQIDGGGWTMVGSARRPATFYLLVGRAVGRPGWCIAAGAVRSTRSTVTLQWIPTERWYGRGVERARHAARGRRGRAPAPACLALVSKLAVRVVAWLTTTPGREILPTTAL